METKEKTILVTGATGKQGGAVARHLLERGFRVLALTRDPQKAAAHELELRGALLVRGDLDDMDSIDKALEGVYGVFSVQNFWETGAQQEVKQGIALADAALRKGVTHFVYSSVGGAERHTGLAHFDSKWQIEEHIRRIGLPYTILRPVFFMENFQAALREPILSGILPQPLDPDVPLQMIATDDIGAFAAMAFEHPADWVGREIEIAGDELTMQQVVQVFSRLLGHEVSYVQVTWEKFREQAGEEYAKMYRWFNDYGYEADIEQLRQEYPHLTKLEAELKKENWPIKISV